VTATIIGFRSTAAPTGVGDPRGASVDVVRTRTVVVLPDVEVASEVIEETSEVAIHRILIRDSDDTLPVATKLLQDLDEIAVARDDDVRLDFGVREDELRDVDGHAQIGRVLAPLPEDVNQLGSVIVEITLKLIHDPILPVGVRVDHAHVAETGGVDVDRLEVDHVRDRVVPELRADAVDEVLEIDQQRDPRPPRLEASRLAVRIVLE